MPAIGGYALEDLACGAPNKLVDGLAWAGGKPKEKPPDVASLAGAAKSGVDEAGAALGGRAAPVKRAASGPETPALVNR